MIGMRIMELDARNYASLMEEQGIKCISDLVDYDDKDLKRAFKMRRQHRENILNHLTFLRDIEDASTSPPLSPRHLDERPKASERGKFRQKSDDSDWSSD